MGLQSLRNYFQNLTSKTKEDIKEDLKQVKSLQLKGSSPDGRFSEYIDSKERKRVKIHPADLVTLYPHLHIYNSQGDSLTKDLEVEPENSPNVHLKIKKS